MYDADSVDYMLDLNRSKGFDDLTSDEIIELLKDLFDRVEQLENEADGL